MEAIKKLRKIRVRKEKRESVKYFFEVLALINFEVLACIVGIDFSATSIAIVGTLITLFVINVLAARHFSK